MKYKNSFFRIEIKENGTYLDIFPALTDGKRLTIKEIVDFLDSKGIDYELNTVKKALEMVKDKPARIKLTDTVIAPFGESAAVTVSEDNMLATIRFYPPSTGGKLMDKKEILSELDLKKVCVGISHKMIELFMQGRQYCVNLPIAKGVKMVPSKDTVIEYMFDARPLAKPKMLEDGSVDFHELNLFTRVSKGQILARLTPHVVGTNGLDVFGKTLTTTKPKVRRFKYGKNITVSEDGAELISGIDGDVSLINGTVFVSNTYNVASDVDASTGDLDYDGSIFIPGTVRTGFVVKAKGDIQVNGVVEGATLIAGGNIVIKRGVQGMSKGKLVAGGDLCAQFIEGANVETSGNVISGSILHSNIKSGGNVIVSGKKGFIVGGEIVCENLVEVNTIGNKMETHTSIKVGVKPELMDELKELVNVVADMNKDIEENSSYLNTYRQKIKNGVKLSQENIKQVKQYTTKLEELEKECEEKNERIMELRRIIDEEKNGKIKVSGEINVGVDIFIANRTYIVKEKHVHCMLKIKDGEIVTLPF